MAIERRRVLYSGRVQGVGFRFTSHRIAQGYEVGGHVRNLPDGSVEVLVEGKPAEVEAFLGEIRTELGHHIRYESSSPEPPGDPPCPAFVIRY